MTHRNLLRQYDPSEEQLRQELSDVFGEGDYSWLPEESQRFEENQLLTGRVLQVSGDTVQVDVGWKSEGTIDLREWYDEGAGEIVPPKPGDQVPLLLQALEDDTGSVVLSYRKALWQVQWQEVCRKVKEGDTVSGKVLRKVKGGLLVNIGVNVFLPASQIDTRRPHDIGDYIGNTIEAKIVSIDEARHNIVVSRRQLLEEQRSQLKEKLLAEIEPGQIRKGIVKNIVEFGAFVDLGGIDGLLHVTDMSWTRVHNPREIVHPDEHLEVYVLSVDRDRERIALSLKHKTPNPWSSVAEKYPVGSRHTGEVVNVMGYGAFVKLEDGIEGLVHISEMSWLKRINHPSEVVASGDKIEVQVLGINKEKQEISLGMKQVTPNPWDKVAERYPSGAIVTGVVRNLTNYGAFIEIEEGIDGLLHVSDMSWGHKTANPGDIVHKGDKVTCVVLNVDQERKRIALGLKQMASDPWESDIPGRYAPGSIKKGKVTKLTNFGVFVELEPGLEGLLHVWELADHKVENPEDVVKVGDEIEVKVLRVDAADRKIGLSRKRLGMADEPEEVQETSAEPTRTAKPRELRGGTGSGGGQLINLPETGEKT